MFTVEIKINGALIVHIYGRNEKNVLNNKSQYEYEYYEVETRRVTTGKVTHMRSDGITKLISLIIEHQRKDKNHGTNKTGE